MESKRKSEVRNGASMVINAHADARVTQLWFLNGGQPYEKSSQKKKDTMNWMLMELAEFLAERERFTDLQYPATTKLVLISAKNRVKYELMDLFMLSYFGDFDISEFLEFIIRPRRLDSETVLTHRDLHRMLVSWSRALTLRDMIGWLKQKKSRGLSETPRPSVLMMDVHLSRIHVGLERFLTIKEGKL